MTKMYQSLFYWYYEVKFLNKLLTIYIILNSIFLVGFIFNSNYNNAVTMMTVVTISLLLYIIFIRVNIVKQNKSNKYIETDDLTEVIKVKHLNELKRVEFNWKSPNTILTITSKINFFLSSVAPITYILGDKDLSLFGGTWILCIQHVVIGLLSLIAIIERNEYYETKQDQLFKWVIYNRRRGEEKL